MGSRILVVDDDQTIVRLLILNLELEGHEVAVASNGREALEQVEAFRPDLVLCDVMMPVMNGIEVVSRIRRNAATKDLPVIMLSAKAQEMDIRSGKVAGANDYVTKPFDPMELVALVDRVLRDAKPPAKRKRTARKT